MFSVDGLAVQLPTCLSVNEIRSLHRRLWIRGRLTAS